MKVNFTKLAALLLAGVALFATGCSNDYEVDIQAVDKKVDNLTTEVNGKIASLEQQIAGINTTIATLETIANHDKDIKAVRDEVAALKTTLENDYNAKINKAVADLTAEINKKVNQADYEVDKAAIQQAIKDVNDALDAAKARIKAIEDADFQKQIDELNAALDARLDKLEALLAGDWKGKTVKETIDALAKTVADLETTLNGKISALELRVKANEDAIKKINEETIPALQAQVDDIKNVKIPALETEIEALKNGKLDKATFEAYKTATAETLRLMQEAIQNLADTKLDKTVFDEKVAEIIAKFDDYVLVKDFEAFKKIAATKAELAAVKAELEGRIKVCEDLLAGDWGGQTVKEYIDAKAKALQDQVDNIVNNLIPELDKRISALEKSVNEVILPQIAFALEYEGGLQGYIDDAAYAAYLDAVEYVDEYMEFLIDQLNEIFDDIYTQLETMNARIIELFERIQSIQFVPEYDDLKITSNMAYVYQPVDTEEEIATLVIDQPTKVTYQFLPAQYAPEVAAGVEDLITDANYTRFLLWLFYDLGDPENEDPFTREELKDIKLGGILPFFDVRPVDTRDDVAVPAARPQFIITGIDKVDENTGEITFIVQPLNIASAQFEANGLKPMYNVGITDGNGRYLMGFDDPDPWAPYSGLFRAEDPIDPEMTYSVPVWSLSELQKYQARTAFAAQLRMYALQDVDTYEDYDWDNCDWDRFYEDWDYWPDIITYYTDYENELASPYNVLYPAVSTIEILPDPYHREDDGSIRPFTEDEIYQTLPYSALRKDGENAIGEKPEQNPKGYRIILDQAVPAVSINGGEPMSLEEAAEAGYRVPDIEISFDEFTYADKAGDELAEEREVNFVETPGVYAEIEMNEEVPASTRKREVGDVITGTYAFTSVLGTFNANGYVTITKPEGSVNVSADINWVYAQDADTDHDVYYNDAEAKYSHDDEPVTIDAESANYLEETLGITLADFAGKTPKYLTIEPDGLTISDVSIVDGALTADFGEFEWGKTYTVKAVYELDAAEVTVNGTVTTTDRKRDLIEITLDEYVFDLNGDDYDATNDTYTSEPQEFQQPLFDKFVENAIINQGTPLDFADADAFVGVDNNGKEGGLRVVTDEDNSTFLVIADDNATIIATSAELKEIMGTSQVIYVTTYIGQKVKIIVPVNVNLPAYDFLHLRYYTFNKDEEVADFITKRDFADNDGNVKWWTQVNPSYFTTVDPNAVPGDASTRISYRHALADYDVAYINLAELAFNVVDEKDDVMDEAAIAAAKLVVKFDYSVKNQGTKALPTVDQLTSFKKYSDLWVDNTVFYYRTNAKKFIPAKGTLAILSGDTEFPLPTRFDTPKNSVKNPEIALDYSSYAVVRWTPFKAPVATGYTIVLDENKIYEKPLFEGMELQDNRPSGVSYYVIKNGEWVKGNVTTFNPESSTAPAGGNGYINDIMANDAYHITTTFNYDVTGIPVDLRKLLKVETKDGVPYIIYDYRSQVEFHGVITIPVTVSLENPWQETINFEYNVTIKGVGD